MDVMIGTTGGDTFHLDELPTNGHLKFSLETREGGQVSVELPGNDLAFILMQLSGFAAWTQRADD